MSKGNADLLQTEMRGRLSIVYVIVNKPNVLYCIIVTVLNIFPDY